MKLIVSGIVLVLIDMMYLSMVSKKYGKMIKDIQGSEMKTRIKAAIVCYILLILGLNYFILNDDNKNSNDAFILGLVIYGVFDSTNYALIKKWDKKMAIIDTIWGGTLFYLSTNITKYLIQ